MRILIVSNLYPPHYVGGYELRCSQVAEHLQRIGHEVRVLTSSYRLPTHGNSAADQRTEIIRGVQVGRSLRYRPFEPCPRRFYLLTIAKRQLPDARRFIEILDEFQPDIVNWWNMEGLTKTILPIPAMRCIPDVCFVEDCWLISEYDQEYVFWSRFWQGAWRPLFFRPLLRRFLAPWESRVHREGIPTRSLPNLPSHVCFVSEFLRFEHINAGLVFPSSEVIYGGVFPERFYVQRATSDFVGGGLRFLYAGQVDPERGLDTIIEAFGLLPLDLRERVELSIAHSDQLKPTKYFADVKLKVDQLGLSNRVKFLGRVEHDDMPHVYRNSQVLIFASIRKEGLPMTMMEAMCAGCAVITTGSGGAVEIADIADLPLFPKDHPVALSRLIARLIRDRKLVSQIAKRGQDVVLSQFTFGRMMESLCDTFRILCERKGRQARLHDMQAQ